MRQNGLKQPFVCLAAAMTLANGVGPALHLLPDWLGGCEHVSHGVHGGLAVHPAPCEPGGHDDHGRPGAVHGGDDPGVPPLPGSSHADCPICREFLRSPGAVVVLPLLLPAPGEQPFHSPPCVYESPRRDPFLLPLSPRAPPVA